MYTESLGSYLIMSTGHGRHLYDLSLISISRLGTHFRVQGFAKLNGHISELWTHCGFHSFSSFARQVSTRKNRYDTWHLVPIKYKKIRGWWADSLFRNIPWECDFLNPRVSVFVSLRLPAYSILQFDNRLYHHNQMDKFSIYGIIRVEVMIPSCF